ncbi:MAG: hypothetical protein MUC63_03000 [Planctomycetes bacterium]|nr:hypothetical protein [Planctomycetota bacterium]MCU0727724.1 hypothetical protein [Planctomycetota bacterium]
MLSTDCIDRYRRMTPAERLRETVDLLAFADAALDALPARERERRLAIFREQHRRSNEALLRGLGLR